MNRLHWLIACVAAGVSVAALAQEKVNLKINYEPGVYVVTQNLRSTIQRNGEEVRSQVNTIEMTVGKADAKGNRSITLTYREVKAEYTEDGLAKPHGMIPIVNAMLNKPVTFTIDARGKPGKLTGMEKIYDAIPEADKKTAERLLPKQFTNILCTLTMSLPSKSVKIDDAWAAGSQVAVSTPIGGTIYLTPLEGVAYHEPVEGITFTLAEVKNGVATVTGTMTIGEPSREAQSFTTTALIDVATGLATSVTLALETVSVRTRNGDTTVYLNDDADKLKITVTKGAYKPPKESPREAPKTAPAKK